MRVQCQPLLVQSGTVPALDMFPPLVHNEPMNIKEWLNTLPGAPTVSQAADHAEVSKATFLRHEKKGETTAEFAIKIARAYSVNEVQALLDLGFIEEAAVLELAVEAALGFAKNSQLYAEMNKRNDPDERRLYRSEGIPGVIDLDDETVAQEDAQVFEFPTSKGPAGWQDYAVADSSPDHDEEDTDFD